MEDFPSFGSRLRQLRSQKKLSQEKLGIIAGIPEGSASDQIGNYERDENTSPFERLANIVRALEADPAWLLTGESYGVPPHRLKKIVRDAMGSWVEAQKSGTPVDVAYAEGYLHMALALTYPGDQKALRDLARVFAGPDEAVEARQRPAKDG